MRVTDNQAAIGTEVAFTALNPAARFITHIVQIQVQAALLLQRDSRLECIDILRQPAYWRSICKIQHFLYSQDRWFLCDICSIQATYEP